MEDWEKMIATPPRLPRIPMVVGNWRGGRVVTARRVVDWRFGFSAVIEESFFASKARWATIRHDFWG